MKTAIALLAMLAASHAADPLVLSEFIYETAPFPSCHASTIAETKSGLIARPPHSPTPVPALTVSGAAGAKANS